jgi:phosphatidylserine/phosphatidylglycerophosphate/cardiolipin synthase-like enzyme
MRKLLLFVLSAALFGQAALAQEAKKPADTAWLAQSVPLETVYGSTETLRPQKVWVDMINSAKDTLEMGEFYFESKDGEALEPVLNAIRAAAKRGVTVRIIADGAFYKKDPDTVNSLRPVKNITIRIIPFEKLHGGVMHAKYFIVDGKSLYVGSQNMDWRSLIHIHEVGMRIENPRMARAFRRIFYMDWKDCAFTPEHAPVKIEDDAALTPSATETLVIGGEPVSAYAAFDPSGTLPGKDLNEIDELVRLIDSAKSSIHAQVMTYSLVRKGGDKWRQLDDALRRAALRGVLVKLVFADWSMGKKNADDIRALARTANIEVRISTIPEYSKGHIDYARVEHCKYMVVDGIDSVVSTSNWEYDYFYSSRDAAIIMHGAKSAGILEGIFNTSWNGPYVKPVSQIPEPQTTIQK